MLNFILFVIIGYLCGSLSSAIIVCKVMGLPDPRTQGSNNPGATNVMRIGGKKAAYMTFVGDFLKGFLPIIVVQLLLSNDNAVAGVALGAFLGHLYPLYFGFKGGKGVATLVGVIIAVSPLTFVIVGVCWLATLFTTGYVSLGSMIGAVVAVIVTWALGYSAIIVITFFILAILVIYRHRENIARLRNGTENHFRKKENKQ